MEELQIIRPDDWHLHLREGELMSLVVNQSANWCGRAMIMPNLEAPVTTVSLAAEYRKAILSKLPADVEFNPLMTIYLTPEMKPAEVAKLKETDWGLAVKYYPAGATTLSEFGVKSIDQCAAVFEKMMDLDIPLSVHGEVADPEIDIFDREKVFIETIMEPLRSRYPELRIIFEHLTTREAVQYVRSVDERLAGTITAHHLLLSRNNILVGGIRPHHFCLPIAKREEDRLALVEAAAGGDPRFFIGTDSAPHPLSTKECGTGKAGVYTGYNAIALYAEVFEAEGRLSALEAFTSKFGARFYGLPENSSKLTLVKQSAMVPDRFGFGDDFLVPFKAGEVCQWAVK